MTQKIQRLFAWLQKNERHISAPMFVMGFITDLVTVVPLSLQSAIYLYGVYLTISAVATISSHYLFVHDAQEGPWLRALRILLSLAAQFTTGGLLSGFLIFYTRSAALTASWPFVVMLAVIFIGNEAFRHYREQIAFRSGLFFFSLYAYLIFTLPMVLHTISPKTFLESTGTAFGIFLAFLILLGLVGWKRLRSSLLEISIGVGIVICIVVGSYFTGIIPPLPLSLTDSGVYHSIAHTSQGYESQAESLVQKKWWDIGNFEPVTVHILPGEPLSVFSSVFAPTSFSTAVMHKWEFYDGKTHTWQTKAVIAFTIAGGRDGGYRGYSTLSTIVPGYYRVSIETLSGQVIGRIYFGVEYVSNSPVLHTEIH